MNAATRTKTPEPTASRKVEAAPAAMPRGRGHSFLKQLGQCLLVAALTLVCYFFISHYLLQSVTVVGRSMTPTLADSERYLLNRWIYLCRAPRHGEVVVLRDLIDSSYSVKRVIGGPGDSILLKGGKVYVNGSPLEEPYLPPSTPTFTYAPQNEQAFKCGSDQYFVLGDNRLNSADSRIYGPVPRQNILGLIIH